MELFIKMPGTPGRAKLFPVHEGNSALIGAVDIHNIDGRLASLTIGIKGNHAAIRRKIRGFVVA